MKYGLARVIRNGRVRTERAKKISVRHNFLRQNQGTWRPRQFGRKPVLVSTLEQS